MSNRSGFYRTFWRYSCIKTGERLLEGRFPRTPDGIAAFVARCTPQMAVAVEATRPTWSFVDQIVDHVGHVCVGDTRKTKPKLDRDLTAQLAIVDADVAREAAADPIVQRLQTLQGASARRLIITR